MNEPAGGAAACRAAIAAAWLAMGVAGCAPTLPHPVALDLRTLEQRYDAALTTRTRAGGNALAEVSLWLATRSHGRYPGVRGELRLAGLDSLRLQIASSFGVALDLAGAGDSVLAWVPGRRTVVVAAAAEPPMAFPGAVRWMSRAAAATWRVPDEAWGLADSLGTVGWREGGDSVVVAIGASGLPRQVRYLHPGMSALLVTYSAYQTVDGVAWPAKVVVTDADGSFELTARLRRARFDANIQGVPVWPELPADTRRAGAEDLTRWIEAGTIE
jgi:hypothetical protein